MSIKNFRLSAWSIAIAVLASVGCGGAKAPAVQTEMVEGLVTLDGQPVPGATITFVPVQPGAGASATGMTDSEGKYHLTAVGAGIGAQPGAGTLPGEYSVGVMKVNLPDIPTEQDLQADLGTPGTPSKSVGSGERPKDVQVTHVVPQKFNDPLKSGIKVTVKPGANDIPIPLVSK